VNRSRVSFFFFLLRLVAAFINFLVAGTKGIIWGVCTVGITLLVMAAFAYFAKKELEKLQEEQDKNSDVNDSSGEQEEEESEQRVADGADEESQKRG